MANLVEIQSPDGEISTVTVNNRVLEILTQMHLPPYMWSELITANQINAAEMDSLIEQYYPRDPDSKESDV